MLANPTVIIEVPISNPGRVAPFFGSADRSSCARFVDKLSNPISSRKSTAKLAGESEVRPENIQVIVREALAEEGPNNQAEDKVPLLYSDDSDVLDEEEPDLLCLENLEDLESLLILYFPKCMAPEVFDTFLVIHQISLRRLNKRFKYLLSCTRVGDTVKMYQSFNRLFLPLNCRDAEEVIARYTRDFMKAARTIHSLQNERPLLKDS
ncbi:hypothetical protein P9112_001598 [Eukaryota sp. TZLM1-RC]